MGKVAAVGLPRVVRWTLWLCAGMIFGLGVGFALALTKPRVKG
jgi:hypothetical protein